jgi:hypothetical protein
VTGRCTGDSGCESNTDETACTDAACEWETPCAALIDDCSSLVAAAPCNLQQGCSWNVDDGVCEDDGQATTCASIMSQTSCIGTSGCNWAQSNMTCQGTATECVDIDVAECTSQSGCAVE